MGPEVCYVSPGITMGAICHDVLHDVNGLLHIVQGDANGLFLEGRCSAQTLARGA